MPYFMFLLPYLKGSLTLILLLCLLPALSCVDNTEKTDSSNPYWYLLNEQEDNLKENESTFTKVGTLGLRFHVSPSQKPFNANDSYLFCGNNVVQMDTNNLVLTPNFYGSVTEEKFPKTLQKGIEYKFYDGNKQGGMPLVFLEEWLAIDPIDYKEAILIIATGIEGKLGVSEELKKTLKDKKKKGEIKDYYILTSKHALAKHNNYIKDGKKVFTFIHLAG